MANNVNITIDGAAAGFAGLVRNMSVTVTLENGRAVSVAATTGTGNQVTQQPNEPTPTGRYSTEGTVSAINIAQRTITIEIRILSPRGTITTETRTFNLADSATAVRFTTIVNLSNIAIGEIATIEHTGQTAYRVFLEERTSTFEGTLRGRSQNNNVVTLIIEDSQGTMRELSLNNNTEVERNGRDRNITWEDLRIGDEVTVTAEYGVITEISAEGDVRNINGIVREVNITAEGSSVVIENAQTGALSTFVLDPSVDPHGLRLGIQVRLRLDSDEVVSYTFVNLRNQNMSGFVRVARSDYIEVAETRIGGAAPLRIYIQNNTTVVDAVRGRTVAASAIRNGNRIFVVYDVTDSRHVARSITILEN